MLKLVLKIVIALAFVAGLGLAAHWIGSQEGFTVIEAGGRELAVPTWLFFSGIALTFVVLWIGAAILRHGFGVFGKVAAWFTESKKRQGLDSLSRSLIAMAEGDGDAAQREARRAERLLEHKDLTRLVSAQAARLAGDHQTAERYFEEMAADGRTGYLGVMGMLRHALQDDKPERALKLASRASELRPREPEVAEMLLGLQLKKGDYAGARDSVRLLQRAGRITRDVADRRAAVLFWSEARDKEIAGESDKALELAMKSTKIAPGLAPAAAMAARMLGARGRKREASRELIAAWRDAPHPDLSSAYAALEPSESPTMRRQRFERMLAANPKHPESQLLRAELALSADQPVAARQALGDLAEKGHSTRACAIRAALEQAQGSDDAVVRTWLAKAAAAPRGGQWVCGNCGAVSDAFNHTCGNCGAFDQLTWARVDPAGAPDESALFLAPPNGNGEPKPPADPAQLNGGSAGDARPKEARGASGTGGAVVRVE